MLYYIAVLTDTDCDKSLLFCLNNLQSYVTISEFMLMWQCRNL